MRTKIILSDLIGKRYGRLIIESAERKFEYKALRIICQCICDCGRIKNIRLNALSKSTFSCGCLNRENIIKLKTTHGLYSNTLSGYTNWEHMKLRCSNKAHKGYMDYGGRGITVCDRWINSFENFYIDMGLKPTVKHEIERINNNGNYEPSNCRWATRKEQCRNTRQNHFIEFEGLNLCITDWATKLNINPTTLFARISRGWDTKRALLTAVVLPALNKP